MKASVCSKEYASTFFDLFFYLIVLKGCYLNIKSNYAQTPFSVAGFSMNPETENYFVASTEFFFLESICRRNYSYTPWGSLVHTNYNTLVGSTTCKCECFCLFIMF